MRVVYTPGSRYSAFGRLSRIIYTALFVIFEIFFYYREARATKLQIFLPRCALFSLSPQIKLYTRARKRLEQLHNAFQRAAQISLLQIAIHASGSIFQFANLERQNEEERERGGEQE